MKISILTLFPEIFESTFKKSIIKRAIDKKLIAIEFINIRDFGLQKHKIIDDKPYGGGNGMIMMIEPIAKALSTIRPKPYTILLSPSGKKYSQKTARLLSKKKYLAIICGHYEGIDARTEELVQEIISIGDFIVTGGEIPSMLIVDSVTRLVPGVISKKSLDEESFSGVGSYSKKSSAYLEYPQYTRPQVFKNKKVPQILLSGNHAKIRKWRKEQSLKRIQKNRPDLLKD